MENQKNQIAEEFKNLQEVVSSAGGNFDKTGITEAGTLAMGKVSEVVGKSSEKKSDGHTTAQFSDDDKKSLFALLDFSLISDKINALVRSNSNGNKKIPSPEQQVKLVKKSLEKEQKNLIKQAKKIQNSRRFSAAKLEKVLLQIREIQKLLKEIVTAAKDRIEELYKKFVIRTV